MGQTGVDREGDPELFSGEGIAGGVGATLGFSADEDNLAA